MLQNEKNVSALVRQRKSLGLTQAEYAEKLGISRNYLALMETGKRPITDSAWNRFVTIAQDSETKSTKEAATEIKEAEAHYDGIERDVAAMKSQIEALRTDVALLKKLILK